MKAHISQFQKEKKRILRSADLGAIVPKLISKHYGTTVIKANQAGHKGSQLVNEK